MKLIHKLYSKIRSEKRPIRFLLSRVLWKTGLCRLFLVKCNGYKLRFYPSAISCGMWVDPFMRREDEDFVRDYVKKGDMVIDIGANIGTLTIVASLQAEKEGKVFSFEPHPKIFNYLEKNVSLNKLKNVNAYNIALGNHLQSTFLSSDQLDDMNSIVKSSHRAVKIKIDRLDNILQHQTKIALMKIDVEGYEKFILEGAEKLLHHTNCLYFESSEDHFKRYGYSSSDLFDYILSFGFQIYSLLRGVLTPIPNAWISHYGENLVAIKCKEDFIKRTGYLFVA